MINPPSSVRRAPLDQPSPVARQRNPSEGLLLIAFGIPFLLANIRYTVIGWYTAINFALAAIHLPLALPPIDWHSQVAAMLVLGYIYTRVELRAFGAFATWRHSGVWRVTAELALCWALVIASDFATTVMGVQHPDPDAWAISLWLARTMAATIAWSVLLTFPPVWMILNGLRHLRRR